MTYKIIDTDGTLIDQQQWPGRWCLQAVQLEEYCDDHRYELVRARPNPTFTEVTVTVRKNR